MSILEGGCLQTETGVFGQSKHDVHVLDSLPHGSLQQVVDDGGDDEFVTELFAMYQTFVGVHHLLQVDSLVAVVGEGGILVEILIVSHDILKRFVGLDYLGHKDTTGEC